MYSIGLTSGCVPGPNGSGKSSLFRVLGGLWPLVAGRITKPGTGADLSHEIFYVPQRPYMAVGTLRDQLIYPLTAAEETQPLTMDGMHELLRNVDLEYLLERYLPAEEVNWANELSLGEQQRLGMARLFYHRPAFAILDECTSAVTTDMEERFCKKVRAMGTSCVTISHRPALVAFHDTVLSLDGEGGWSVHYKRDTSLQILSQDDKDYEDCELQTDWQSDAGVVQEHFVASTTKDTHKDSQAEDTYMSTILATSPPPDILTTIPVVPRLHAEPRIMPARVSSLSKVLVSLP
jgi:ABC-type protease/lipase transport system fused ATPase/permease subunit